MGILERIAVPLLVAPGSPTGSSSYAQSLRVRPEVCKNGEALFENAGFTIEFMFYSRWFGVISLDFSSIVYRSVDFIPCIDTLVDFTSPSFCGGF